MHNGLKLYKTLQNNKPNILIFIDWFIPAYKAGGPIKSVYNIIQQLNTSFNFYVVTSDADIDKPLKLPSNKKNRWLDQGNYQVMYLDQAHQNRKTYKSILTEMNVDTVYLNSLFSLHFTLLPLSILSSRKVKIVLAPRGMLGQGALSIKPVKKKIYLYIFKLLGWHKTIKWHATAETERLEITKNFGYKVLIDVASNLSKKSPDVESKKNKVQNELNVFFLSRISFKKNLKAAINILQAVDSKLKVNFTIIGPVEDKAYWKECEDQLHHLPKHVKYSITGAVPNEKIANILKDQHVLLLPTRHENFGHVIIESWQNACPVLISDQTPWTELEERKVGVDIPLTQEHLFTEKVELLAAMSQEKFNSWSIRARSYASQITNDENLIQQYINIFSAQV